jgi:hypothetical protein
MGKVGNVLGLFSLLVPHVKVNHSSACVCTVHNCLGHMIRGQRVRRRHIFFLGNRGNRYNDFPGHVFIHSFLHGFFFLKNKKPAGLAGGL